MKALKKAFRISMIFIVLFALIAAPLLVMGFQGSITVGKQQIDLNFGSVQPAADSPLFYGCCGSGNGGSD
ncbi:MAG: hypothetical protein PVF83_02815 [Anaerolineales bacterium]|jgi:hypothetical protein